MLKRLLSSLTTWPDGRGWRTCAAIAAAGLSVIGVVAWFAGLWAWRPDMAHWPQRLFMVMLVPALTEEMVFRGLLVPDEGESRQPVLWIAGSSTVFMVWHVVEAMTFLPGAHDLFLTAGFLVCANFLGLACALMRYHSRSLWPAMLFHGLVVFAWQVCLGGPDVKSLMS